VGVELASEHALLGQFASNKGYSDLIDAAKRSEYPALAQFFKHGATESTGPVKQELQELVSTSDSDVATTAGDLLRLIGNNDLVIITDGTGEEDDGVDKTDSPQDPIEAETGFKALRQPESPSSDSSHGPDGQFEFSISGRIVKLDQAQHLVFGWASIVEVGGKPLVDTQGDVITPEQIESTAYEFVLKARAADTMHEEKKIGELVESVVFTREKQAAIVQSLAVQNIPATLDLGCVGWFIGFHVEDPAVWADISSGKLASFSIGGTGRREKIDVTA
jgi:hypothetical protein